MPAGRRCRPAGRPFVRRGETSRCRRSPRYLLRNRPRRTSDAPRRPFRNDVKLQLRNDLADRGVDPSRTGHVSRTKKTRGRRGQLHCALVAARVNSKSRDPNARRVIDLKYIAERYRRGSVDSARGRDSISRNMDTTRVNASRAIYFPCGKFIGAIRRS